MSKGREIHCFDYVNRPYDEVRTALGGDAAGVFQSATKSAAARARSVASALSVRIAGVEVSRDITITVDRIEQQPRELTAPPSTSIDLKWAAADAAQLFPLMKAELRVYPLTATETQLDFLGRYDPPLGVLGGAMDAVVGHRIAEATVHRFVRDVAEFLRDHPGDPLRVRRFPDPGGFLAAAGPFLEQAEAENNLILGVVGDLPEETDAYLFAVEDAGRVVAAGFRTPPLKLVLSPAPPEAVRAVAADCLGRQPDLPAVLAPEAEAGTFAEEWRRATGKGARCRMRLRIFRLDRVVRVGRPAPGRMRPVGAVDVPRLASWMNAFAREARVEPVEDPAAALERRARDGTAYVWENGGVVALAGFGGATPNGIRIGLVYTPPEERRRGYGTSLVAQLSALLLKRHRFCFLFTDLANPVSNGIYQRIGYRPVTDVVDYVFE